MSNNPFTPLFRAVELARRPEWNPNLHPRLPAGKGFGSGRFIKGGDIVSKRPIYGGTDGPHEHGSYERVDGGRWARSHAEDISKDPRYAPADYKPPHDAKRTHEMLAEFNKAEPGRDLTKIAMHSDDRLYEYGDEEEYEDFGDYRSTDEAAEAAVAEKISAMPEGRNKELARTVADSDVFRDRLEQDEDFGGARDNDEVVGVALGHFEEAAKIMGGVVS